MFLRKCVSLKFPSGLQIARLVLGVVKPLSVKLDLLENHCNLGDLL